MIHEACWTTPNRNVTVFEGQAAHWIGPAFATPQEYGGQAERDGHDGSPGILLITILMEPEFGACVVAIDQASVGIVVDEARFGGGAHGEVQELIGHGGPGSAGIRVYRVVPVAGAVGYPADAAAIRHPDRHGVTAGRNQVAEWGGLRDPRYLLEQRRRFRKSEAAQ